MFNKTIKNIMSNYIPHETITCNDRDPCKSCLQILHSQW